MKLDYRHTRRACYAGYFIQALVCNLTPLLFVIFQKRFEVSLSELSYLILFSFLCQLLMDFFCTRFGDRIGFRRMAFLCHGACFLGLIMLAVLPILMKNTYLALILSALLYSFGGGMLEVLLNPIMNALPEPETGSKMSLLHSFYSWGQMATVALSTVFLKIFGDGAWFLLPALWSLLPLYNLIRFLRVPLPEAVPAEQRSPLRELFSKRAFILMFLIMFAAGASEMAMSQWASFFAERGLGVSKFMGDLLGPCLFALLMGLGRTLYGFYGHKWPLSLLLPLSAVLCIGCYLTAVLAKSPVFALLGCAVCGFSVCLMWPGTLSIASHRFITGGTAMFGVLAIAGDIGCSVGPWLSGLVSDSVQSLPQAGALAAQLGIELEQVGLKAGLLVCCLFPLILILCALMLGKSQNQSVKCS